MLETYPKLPYMEAVQLLRDSYAQSYGICDFARQSLLDQNAVSPGTKRPLFSVAMHYAEDFASTSKKRNIMSRYADSKVKERYGLSLLEFLDLPKEDADFILKDCEKAMEKTLSASETALKNIEAGMTKIK